MIGEIILNLKLKKSAFALLVCISLSFNLRSQIPVQEPSNGFTENIRLYQRFLSSALGTNCSMFPSCSNYGLQSFSKRPIVMGFVRTSDRLLRCGHDIGSYSKIVVKNELRLYDPLIIHNSARLTYSSVVFSDSIPSSYPFIRYLISNHDFNDALLEIRRVEYLDSFNVQVELNELRGICLYKLGRFEELKEQTLIALNSSWSFRLEELLGDAYACSSLFNDAIQVYSELFSMATTTEDVDRLNRKIIYCKCKLDNWDNALSIYNSLDVTNTGIEMILNKGVITKKKKPSLAKCLAILPGLGYLYSGNRQTALTSFCFNSLTMFASYDLIRNKQYGMGALMSAMSLSFYFGNIYGSGRAAKQYNYMRAEQLLGPVYKWAGY